MRQEDSYLKLDNMKEAEKALLVLTRSLLNRMRIDLISTAKGVGHDSVSTREVVEMGQWVARPQILRLTTRPRTPLNPDGSRSRSSSRISKSCDMPSIAFSSLNKIEGIAQKIVHDALVPLFRRLHPETSDWDLSLINVCAANMLHLASDDRNGAGRNISHMFRKQVEVLKEWNVESDGITHSLKFQRSGDKDSDPLSPMSGASISEEAFRDGREGQLTSIQDKRVNENASNRKEKVVGIDEVCEICGAHMPVFAILAHERFHSMPD